MEYTAKIYVTLKPSILDPQGRAVENALHNLNHQNVENIRIGKYIEMQMKGDLADLEKQLSVIVTDILSNPVMEDATWELIKK